MLDYCIGEVGLRPDEFWSMTFREVEAACKGYETRLARSLELQRFTASVLINANRKKGAKAVRPEEILPLVTDKRHHGPVELISKEEYEIAKQLIGKVVWQDQN